MNIKRSTKKIMVGKVAIGGDSDISIQSMTNTNTKDIKSTLNQIIELYNVGCDLVRVAIFDYESAECINDIIKNSPIPIIGDVHLKYDIALRAISSGVHCIRINPSNINEDGIKKIVKAAGEANIPIRIGLNTGSIRKFQKNIIPYEMQNKEDLSNLLVNTALNQCNRINKYGFDNLKISMKSTDVLTTILAYRKFSKLSNYPLHLGVTESGIGDNAIIKSSIGIGSLLIDGIGDTFRVSITGNPVKEVIIARMILESIGLRTACPEIISCPTCARNSINLLSLSEIINKKINIMKSKKLCFKSCRIALMGCKINGIEEVQKSDIGIMGADGLYLFFKDGNLINRFKNLDDTIDLFEKLIKNYIEVI